MAVAAADDLLLQVTEKLFAMGIGDVLFLLKQQQGKHELIRIWDLIRYSFQQTGCTRAWND